jgi:hypothetical protein
MYEFVETSREALQDGDIFISVGDFVNDIRVVTEAKHAGIVFKVGKKQYCISKY